MSIYDRLIVEIEIRGAVLMDENGEAADTVHESLAELLEDAAARVRDMGSGLPAMGYALGIRDANGGTVGRVRYVRAQE